MPKAKNELSKAEGSELANPSFEPSALSFRLGYDAKRATNNLTGLGNYSRSLIEQLAITHPENQYFLYSPKAKSSILDFALFRLKNVLLRFPDKSKGGFLWRSFGIKNQIKEDKIDVFHGLSHEIPYGLQNIGTKSIVTIHDLIFLRRPADYAFIDRIIYNQKAKYACKNADKIIAISEKTKEDIIEFYRIPEDKIEVIYQTCDDAFKQSVSDKKKKEVAEKYQLPKNFILSVGTIEPRKNLLLVVKALAHTKSAIPLVVIGKAKPYFKKVEDEIKKLGLESQVIFLKNIPFADLPTIYQLANLFVYPSFYEGFGIPIIEALFSKVPVIASKGSCLEEAGGPNSIYVNPTDHLQLATEIDKVLASDSISQNMIDKGYDFVQKFSGSDISEQLMNCYRQTLHK